MPQGLYSWSLAAGSYRSRHCEAGGRTRQLLTRRIWCHPGARKRAGRQSAECLRPMRRPAHVARGRRETVSVERVAGLKASQAYIGTRAGFLCIPPCFGFGKELAARFAGAEYAFTEQTTGAIVAFHRILLGTLKRLSCKRISLRFLTPLCLAALVLAGAKAH